MYLVSCTKTHVTDWQTMGWLKIEKHEYLENGTYFFYEIKQFLTCASDDTFSEVIVF